MDNNKNMKPLSEAELTTKGAMLPPFPFMRPEECELIEAHLEPHHAMLEWGSGYSTIRFSQQVAEYYSIEEDKDWYDRISPQVGDIHYHHVEGTPLPNGEERKSPKYNPYKWHRPAGSWAELSSSLRSKQFQNYINSVKLLNQIFEIVFIDGRARCECARAVIPFIRPKTLIFFHDWHRPHYHIIRKRYKLIEVVASMAMLKLK